MTLVTLENVSRRFGEFPVLEGLSLRVDEGDRIGVVGDNGAGKSTMVRILAGVDEADLGQRTAGATSVSPTASRCRACRRARPSASS